MKQLIFLTLILSSFFASGQTHYYAKSLRFSNPTATDSAYTAAKLFMNYTSGKLRIHWGDSTSTVWPAEGGIAVADSTGVAGSFTPVRIPFSVGPTTLSDSYHMQYDTLNDFVSFGAGASPDRKLHVEKESAATNTVTYLNRLTSLSSGTPAAGIGVGQEFEVETAAGNNEIAGTIETVLTDVTSASENADMVFKVLQQGAAAEGFRIVSGSGSVSYKLGEGAAGSVRLMEAEGTASDIAVTISGKGVGGVNLVADTPTNSLTIGNGANTMTGTTNVINTETTKGNQIELSSALTNTVGYSARFEHDTSGTPANNIGTGIIFSTETTGGAEEGATIEAVVTDVTSLSEDFDLVFKTMAAGATAAERVRFTSTGAIAVNGASNYGSSGEVLTSNGNAPPTWQAAAGASTWNSITNPTGDQALTFDAGESSTWTNSNTTEDLFTANSSTMTTSSMVSLNSTSTALASGNNLVELVMSGANGTNAITANPLRVSVTNTNATSGTNTGISVAASGATTANHAIHATAGDILVDGASLINYSAAGDFQYPNTQTAALSLTDGTTDHLIIDSSNDEVEVPVNLAIGTTSASSRLDVVSDNAATNTSTTVAEFESSSTGTPAAGKGANIHLKAETAAGNVESGAIIDASFSTVTAAAEASDVRVSNMSNGVNTVRQFIQGKRVTLTESSATTVATINIAGTGNAGGGHGSITVVAADASDIQARTLDFSFVMINDGGSGLATAVSTPVETVAVATGTLTATLTITTSGSDVLIQVNAVSSLTQTSLFCTSSLYLNGFNVSVN